MGTDNESTDNGNDSSSKHNSAAATAAAAAVQAVATRTVQDSALRALTWALPVVFLAGVTVAGWAFTASAQGDLERAQASLTDQFAVHAGLDAHPAAAARLAALEQRHGELLDEIKGLRADVHAANETLAVICGATRGNPCRR